MQCIVLLQLLCAASLSPSFALPLALFREEKSLESTRLQFRDSENKLHEKDSKSNRTHTHSAQFAHLSRTKSILSSPIYSIRALSACGIILGSIRNQYWAMSVCSCRCAHVQHLSRYWLMPTRLAASKTVWRLCWWLLCYSQRCAVRIVYTSFVTLSSEESKNNYVSLDKNLSCARTHFQFLCVATAKRSSHKLIWII